MNICRITDGTTSVSFQATISGVKLETLNPRAPALKSGGVWVESPFTDGRALISKVRTDVTDTFQVYLTGFGIDAVQSTKAALLRLLERATDYWADEWQQGINGFPVWIEMQAHCESNKSYAIIHNYEWSDYTDPFSEPMQGALTSTLELSIEIEHSSWQNVEPGSPAALALWAGDPATNAGQKVANASAGELRAWVGNFYNYGSDAIPSAFQNITHAFWFDGLVYSANYQVAIANWTIGPTAIGDMLYMGSDYPFGSAIFNLVTPSNGTVVYDYEYWDGIGLAWTALSSVVIQPGPAPWEGMSANETGIVSWDIEPTWAKVAVNGETKYWVRIVVNAITVAPIVEAVQNYTIPVYSPFWPWAALPELNGDIPAILDVKLRGQNGGEHFLIGLRSLERGSDFTMYLPCSDLTGILPPWLFASAAPLNQNTLAPYDEVAQVNGPTAGFVNVCEWWFTNPNQWAGRYRAFVRYQDVTGGTTATFQFTDALSPPQMFYSVTADGTAGAGQIVLLDFGIINIDAASIVMSTANRFRLYAEVTSATDIDVFDVILFPVDDCVAEIISHIGDLDDTNYIYLDSNDPKRQTAVIVDNGVAGVQRLELRMLSKLQAKPHTMYRVFVMAFDDAGTFYTSNPHAIVNLNIRAAQRYVFGRGAE